jgi:glucokinase
VRDAAGRALGIDLGGTKLLACVIDAEGRPLAFARRPTGRGTSPREARALVVEVAAELRARAGGFAACGLAFPGLVDAARGAVLSSVMLEGWTRVALADLAAGAIGVPCVVENDANAAALAEVRARGGDVPSPLLFVAVGTGIGGALVVDGRLLRGASGTAGEIGNTTIREGGPACWCGRRGCLNTLASGAALERDLGLAPGTLVDHAGRGDPRVAAAVERAARALGTGLANAMNLLNPALVVLGGGVPRLAGFCEAVARAARAEAFAEAAAACRIEPARAGYEAAALGAALLALG